VTGAGAVIAPPLSIRPCARPSPTRQNRLAATLITAVDGDGSAPAKKCRAIGD